jgi:hypothetical protein
MADRHVLYKHGVKEIAWAQGASVTFMAKYDMGAAGSSCHLHSSVWDPRGRKNLFAAHGSRAGTPLFRHWLAGQMAMARDFAYFYAPTINAYKRYQAGSFAPTRIACGWDNRTCGFRLCGEGASFRVENRIPGADANPYLAFAATIAAGLHGVAEKLEPPALYEGNAYEDAGSPRCRRRCGRPSTSSIGPRRRARPSGRRSSSTTCTTAGSSSRRSTRPSPTGNSSATSSASDRMLKKAHLLRWRPRQPAQRTESTPRRLPSGAASHLDLFEHPVTSPPARKRSR